MFFYFINKIFLYILYYQYREITDILFILNLNKINRMHFNDMLEYFGLANSSNFEELKKWKIKNRDEQIDLILG